MIISNICFLVAMFIFSWGFLKQISKTKKRKSVNDIEIKDVIARALACTFFFIKFCFMGDLVLMIGQGVILILSYCYLVLVIAILMKKEEQLWNLIEDLQNFMRKNGERIMDFGMKL